MFLKELMYKYLFWSPEIFDITVIDLSSGL